MIQLQAHKIKNGGEAKADVKRRQSGCGSQVLRFKDARFYNFKIRK